MDAILIGEVKQPAVAIVGTFDPFSDLHKNLIERAAVYARVNDMACLAIVIDPSPSYFLQCPPRCLTYDHLNARLALLGKYGCSAQLLIRFTLKDLAAGADEFFETVMALAPVRELWLGMKQSLGSGHRGSSPHLDRVSGEFGVQVVRLEHVNTTLIAGKVRSWLESGQLIRAALEVGRTPVWTGSCKDLSHNYWATGRYQVKAFSFSDEKITPQRFDVELVRESGDRLELISRAELPDWITFVSGPNDNYHG